MKNVNKTTGEILGHPLRKRVYAKLVDETINEPRSLTQQQFKTECDINHILHKFQTTGVMPHVRNQPALFADMASAPTYQECLNTVIHSNQQFEALGAHVRDRFNNSPSKFLEFASNPENAQELIKMGLATPKVDPIPPEPQKVFVVNSDKPEAKS